MKWNKWSEDRLPVLEKWIIYRDSDEILVGIFDGVYIFPDGSKLYKLILSDQGLTYKIHPGVYSPAYWSYLSTLEEIEREIEGSDEKAKAEG